MREISLDTETTGFYPENGDRLVEIGCVELMNHMPTGKTYHVYINPERDVPEDAVKVHGLTTEMLKDKPTFREIADEFLEFIGDDPLVIHNAKFDVKFLNAELKWCHKRQIPMESAIDTLIIARKMFPGSRVSLDDLCRRYNVDNSKRTKHGALLDAELLAEVYLELLGGREPGLILGENNTSASTVFFDLTQEEKKPLKESRVFPVPEKDAANHEAFMKKIKNPIWDL